MSQSSGAEDGMTEKELRGEEVVETYLEMAGHGVKKALSEWRKGMGADKVDRTLNAVELAIGLARKALPPPDVIDVSPEPARLRQ